MTPFVEKTIRFLAKTDNSAAIEPLRFLLDHHEREVREKAFESLYLKFDPGIMLELFHRVSDHELEWSIAAFLTPDRKSRLIEAAIRSGDFELVKQGCDMAIRNKLYETLPVINTLLDVPRPEWVDLGTKMILELATLFYNDLVNAGSELERRNMDRRREWFAAQLDEPVRRYSVHNHIEPIKAFLLIAKKNYPLLNNVLNDVHSQACKTIVKMLQESEEGGYYRLLLSFIDDTNAPPVIDIILASKAEKKFVQHMLKLIGPNPAQSTKDALKRFKDFAWIKPGNEAIPDLISGLEDRFVQLIACTNLPRETALAMFELVFSLPSDEGRRAAAQAIRTFSGEDVNRILVQAARDSDPIVCSSILRIMKTRRLKEADQVIMQNVENPSELVRQTIYELMPEFRIESFFQKIDQMGEAMAKVLGRIVRNIDSNVSKQINIEISSAIPIRRRLAIDAIRYMNLGVDYESMLIHLADNDDEVVIRIAACQALVHVLTHDSFKTLQHASHDRNLAVQRAATAASEQWQKNYELQEAGGMRLEA